MTEPLLHIIRVPQQEPQAFTRRQRIALFALLTLWVGILLLAFFFFGPVR